MEFGIILILLWQANFYEWVKIASRDQNAAQF
jgi:hypothetical protein